MSVAQTCVLVVGLLKELQFFSHLSTHSYSNKGLLRPNKATKGNSDCQISPVFEACFYPADLFTSGSCINTKIDSLEASISAQRNWKVSEGQPVHFPLYV